MITLRSTDDRWLSNSFLVAARAGGEAFVVDAGAPAAPLLAACRRHALRITHVLLTHHHPDHVSERGAFVETFGARIVAHPFEASRIAASASPLPPCDLLVSGGEALTIGGLSVKVLHVPGHTEGQLNFLVDGARLFSGDTLFRGSVGGTRAPGHGTIAQLRTSILDVLLALDEATVIHPGHGADTTVGAERRDNPMVLAWTAPSPPTGTSCLANGRAATLLARVPDYDGGTKAWVRHEDGSEDILPGSRVS